MQNSKIELNVEIDENKVPEKIRWSADDGDISEQEAKALFLSIWDAKDKNTLKIDLWVKDMPLDEMKTFFYQIFMSMSDTFLRATNDQKMTDTIKDFCAYFAEKLEIEK